MWGLRSVSRFFAGACGAVLALQVAGAQAADVAVRKAAPEAPPPALAYDYIFGTKILTDYNFRGISQSNRGPAGQSYGELQINNNLFYVGYFASSVDLATDPLAEIDFTFGFRPKFGGLSFDFGGIYYLYPRERQLIYPAGVVWTPRDTDMFEIAGKVSYSFDDKVIVGANVFHAFDWLGTGAEGTFASGTVKVNIPGVEGLAISGEYGRYFLGRVDAYLGGFNAPDYNYWNAGVSYTWKNLTFDVRYHDTDLNRTECHLLTAQPRGIYNGSLRSNWCDGTVVGSISADFVGSQVGIFAPPRP